MTENSGMIHLMCRKKITANWEVYIQREYLFPEWGRNRDILKQADIETDCHYKTLTTRFSQNILQTEGKVILEERSKTQEKISSKQDGKYWANGNQHSLYERE